jgi:integrating conjugative element protein (TIGR03757 family)
MTSLATAAEHIRIEVFTDTDHFPVAGLQSIQGVELIIQDLARPKRLERQLSLDLPKPEAEALPVARQRLEGHWEKLAGEFMAAYQSHTAAMKYWITRYPAMVFDGGRAVVYGVIDLREGLSRYQRWLSTQPAGDAHSGSGPSSDRGD